MVSESKRPRLPLTKIRIRIRVWCRMLLISRLFVVGVYPVVLTPGWQKPSTSINPLSIRIKRILFSLTCQLTIPMVQWGRVTWEWRLQGQTRGRQRGRSLSYPTATWTSGSNSSLIIWMSCRMSITGTGLSLFWNASTAVQANLIWGSLEEQSSIWISSTLRSSTLNKAWILEWSSLVELQHTRQVKWRLGRLIGRPSLLKILRLWARSSLKNK
jgi:hypothetical protein